MSARRILTVAENATSGEPRPKAAAMLEAMPVSPFQKVLALAAFALCRQIVPAKVGRQ